MVRKKTVTYHPPDFTCSSVEEIPFDLLHERRITHLGFDWDGTLMGQKLSALHPGFKFRLQELRRLLDLAAEHGMTEVVVLTNVGAPLPWLIYRTWLGKRHLNVKVVRLYVGFGLKPHRKAFEKLMATFESGTRKTQVAFIGDRLDTDILGAGQFGLTTVWISGSLLEGRRSRRKKRSVHPVALQQFEEKKSRPEA